MFSQEYSPFSDGNVAVWGLFDFREDTESHCVAPSPKVDLYTEAFPLFLPLKTWGHGCGYKRNPVIYVAWQRRCTDSETARMLLPRDLLETAVTVIDEMKTELKDAGDVRASSLDLFDLVPASKEFTDLGKQPEGTFDCTLAVYPLAAALLAAAIDGVGLNKPKAVCFGGWNFYRSKALSGLLSADDVDDKIRTARKCGISEIFFSAPDRLFDSLKERGEDIRRLDEEDSLSETIDPYRKAFQE